MKLVWELKEIKLDLAFDWSISREVSQFKINYVIFINGISFGEVAPNIRFNESGENVESAFLDLKKHLPKYYIENNFGMAMRRLSIIDIAKSNQPIQSEDKNISIIFNGEIYNFIELKDQLKTENIKFRTDGDTEVILKLYEKFGEKFISKLIGTFIIFFFIFSISLKLF